MPNLPPYEFYHLKVGNLPHKCPFLGRRPAWSCKANVEVFNSDGSLAIQNPIPARWTSQPEPTLPSIADGKHVNLLDVAKIIAGRKEDVHQHEDQQISIAIKFEGENECYIFSNESYAYAAWKNPAWRLETGTYRLRVTVFYERGNSRDDFELCNLGPSRNDMHLRLYAKP